MTVEAGLARRDITPPTGTCGRLGPHNRIYEIADTIYVRALCIQVNKGKPVIIIEYDLVGLCESTVAQLKEKIYEDTGIIEERIIIFSIHTHASPWTWELQGKWSKEKGLPVLNEEWFNNIITLTVDVVREALKDIHRVKLFTGTGEVNKIASNRLIITKEGNTIMRGSLADEEKRSYPEGLIDPEVNVLCIKNLQDKVEGILMNYACHPSSLGGGDVPVFSADFPGYAAKYLHEKINPDLFSFYAMGTSGNINPGKYTGDSCSLEVTQMMGKRLGKATHEVVQEGLKELTCSDLDLIVKKISIPVNEDIPDENQARNEFNAACEEFLAAQKSDDITPGIVSRWRTAVKTLDMAVLAGNNSYLAEIKILRLGEIVMIFLPGEFFVEIDLGIKRRSIFNPTFIVTLSNIDMLYIPSQKSFDKYSGGYGVDKMRFISRTGVEILENNLYDIVENLK